MVIGRRLYYACLSLCGIAAAVVTLARGFVDRFVDALMTIAASPQPMLAGGYERVRDDPRAPLDRALQHSMRHEAGVSRRAAERHI